LLNELFRGKKSQHGISGISEQNNWAAGSIATSTLVRKLEICSKNTFVKHKTFHKLILFIQNNIFQVKYVCPSFHSSPSPHYVSSFRSKNVFNKSCYLYVILEKKNFRNHSGLPQGDNNILLQIEKILLTKLRHAPMLDKNPCYPSNINSLFSSLSFWVKLGLLLFEKVSKTMCRELRRLQKQRLRSNILVILIFSPVLLQTLTQPSALFDMKISRTNLNICFLGRWKTTFNDSTVLT